jgi:hypothetical protein
MEENRTLVFYKIDQKVMVFLAWNGSWELFRPIARRIKENSSITSS